jgi:signal transduction histidine kinase
MVMVGFYLSSIFYKSYAGIESLDFTIGSPQFIFVYTVLFAGSALLIFFKPRQEMQELVEEQNQHLSGRVGTQEQELKESAAIKSEFIRNVTHEYHAPMTGISSMAQILAENYDQLTDEQRKQAAKTLLDSSLRLEVFDANISSLSKLSKGKLNLKLETINLSNLVEESVSTCRRLYEKKPEDKKWVLDIDEEITANLDKYYFKQCLDNLIINAISYCHKGRIEVALKQNKYGIHFSISDEGVGIPIEDLYDIFAEFTVSSKTHTPAGGRGIGLTLCKKVIEIHGGTIKAESDGKKGAKFSFVLP